MKSKYLHKLIFYALLFLVGLIYLLVFPQGWLISDEYTYVNQAIAISEGNKSLTFIDPITKELMSYNFTRYSLGNSFWLSIWIRIFGLSNIYMGSLFALLIGSWFLYSSIKKVDYFMPALGLVFIYPSLAFFSSSTMSSMPSFLVSGLFIYTMFIFRESKWKWFWLCVLASFSFWIRETNIVLLGGVCLFHFIQDRRWFGYYFIGSVVGMIPRLLSSYYYYDDPFYYLLAESFSLSYILGNISIYFILTLICMPLGIVFLVIYKGRYRWPIVISSLMFICLYLCYSFNASVYSGFNKGIILMGRFMIPLLPFFVISVAWSFRNFKISKSLIVLWFILVVIVFGGMKYKVNQEGVLHHEISEYVYTEHGNDHVFFDLSRRTNILRYLNPMHGNFACQSDVTRLLDTEYMGRALAQSKDVYIVQTINTANKKKSELTDGVQDIIDQASVMYNISIHEEREIKNGLKLQILQIQESR